MSTGLDPARLVGHSGFSMERGNPKSVKNYINRLKPSLCKCNYVSQELLSILVVLIKIGKWKLLGMEKKWKVRSLYFILNVYS